MTKYLVLVILFLIIQPTYSCKTRTAIKRAIRALGIEDVGFLSRAPLPILRYSVDHIVPQSLMKSHLCPPVGFCNEKKLKKALLDPMILRLETLKFNNERADSLFLGEEHLEEGDEIRELGTQYIVRRHKRSFVLVRSKSTQYEIAFIFKYALEQGYIALTPDVERILPWLAMKRYANALTYRRIKEHFSLHKVLGSVLVSDLTEVESEVAAASSEELGVLEAKSVRSVHSRKTEHQPLDCKASSRFFSGELY